MPNRTMIFFHRTQKSRSDLLRNRFSYVIARTRAPLASIQARSGVFRR